MTHSKIYKYIERNFRQMLTKLKYRDTLYISILYIVDIAVHYELSFLGMQRLTREQTGGKK